MLKKNKDFLVLVALIVTTVILGCAKKWDDHNEISDGALKNSLMEAISKTEKTTKFSELLIKSGYDKILNTSKTFTVWVPSDEALQSLDASIVNDSTQLSQFVGNHISYETYITGSSANGRLRMLNGKYMNVAGRNFDSAQIVTANQYAGNGIFHVIDKAITRKSNIWELVSGSSVASPMKDFMLSLTKFVFDANNAKPTGINPSTGMQEYDTASGMVSRNTFLDSVMNVNDESQEYTLFLLTEAAYNSEMAKLAPWFKATTQDSTNRLSGIWLVKDLVFKGMITPDQISDVSTFTSASNVQVPIKKSAIVASYKTSNGMVYVMNEVNVSLRDKFPPIIIEGEKPTQFAADRRGNTFYRTRVNPVSGKSFDDIYMQNYNYASYWIRYLVKNVPSGKYDVKWVAVNDVQQTPLWSQRLGVDSTTNTNNFKAVTIQYKDYAEKDLGQIDVQNFRDVNLYVIGPTSASNSSGNNSISLDYIKLVPVIP